MARACILTGGFGHPFEATTPILQAQAEASGWTTETVADLDNLISRLEACELVIVNALWWTMTQNEKYAPHRELWAYHASAAQMEALDRFVAGGGRLLVMHTGTICWDNQPLWHEIMGGGWKWGLSHHPPLGEIAVELSEDGQAMVRGCSAHFTLIDEGYRHLSPSADCRILASVRGDEGPQPVVWVRHHGAGSVAVNALGHDARSLADKNHAALLATLFHWLGTTNLAANHH